jgi:hypothetical protein
MLLTGQYRPPQPPVRATVGPWEPPSSALDVCVCVLPSLQVAMMQYYSSASKSQASPAFLVAAARTIGAGCGRSLRHPANGRPSCATRSASVERHGLPGSACARPARILRRRPERTGHPAALGGTAAPGRSCCAAAVVVPAAAEFAASRCFSTIEGHPRDVCTADQNALSLHVVLFRLHHTAEGPIAGRVVMRTTFSVVVFAVFSLVLAEVCGHPCAHSSMRDTMASRARRRMLW